MGLLLGTPLKLVIFERSKIGQKWLEFGEKMGFQATEGPKNVTF